MRELGIREDELDLVHHDRKNTEDSYIDTYSMVYTNLIAIITHELQLEKQRRSNLEVEVADLRSELESMRDNISGDTNLIFRRTKYGSISNLHKGHSLFWNHHS